MIAIIDYGAGNLGSVEKALVSLGEVPVITEDRDIILSADKVILPGVGAFGDAMAKLKKHNLVNTIYDIKNPLLGICLGLQLLFENSEESAGVSGLGMLKGKIIRIPEKEDIKVPHMGWNSLKINNEQGIFKGVEQNSYVYFVHSYYLKATDRHCVTAQTEYSEMLDVAVQSGNLFATQFHPEKSSTVGLKILKNFIDL